MPRALSRLTDPDTLPPQLARPVLAIGNFDGVHRGHRALIEEAVALGKRLARPAVVLTFAPHPRAFFQPQAPQFQLSPPDIQAEQIGRIGVAGIVTLTFDAARAGQSAAAFLDGLLIGQFAMSGLVVGADFHFGKGRAGTPAMLLERAGERGFALRLVEPVLDAGEPISSTRVRAALEAGDCTTAIGLLGYEWFVRGPVIHGEKRGRDLGYPTANMALAPGCRLRHGVYAVRARIDGANHAAIASFGRRPMFDNGAPLLETHVFDFSGDLYGKTIDIAFVRHLRDEQVFAGLDALIAQMDADSLAARTILAEKSAVAAL